MEEKDYKKLYEDTVALAKDGLKDGLYLSQSAKAVTEFLFPQLRETEDEKVKRELTKFLISFNNGYYSRPSEDEIDSWIKWIDKKGEQKTEIKYVYPKFRIGDVIEPIKPNGFYRPVRVLSIDKKNKSYYCESDDKKSFSSIPIRCENEYKLVEQKPADKDEPKFNVGDWITNGYYTWKVTDIKPLDYILQSPNGDVVDDTISYVDENLYLWTIQDAKNGDVVVNKSDGTIGMFQSIGHHPDGGSYNDHSYCFLHCRYDDGFFYADFENGNTMDSDDAIPATKEQRELLFQKMKEAGYEWNAEKKELRKVEQNHNWSEEDEKFLNYAISLTDDAQIKNFLKSLKDRVQPQSKQEWSEEDEDIKETIIGELELVKKSVGEINYKGYDELINWLKSLKPQNNWKPSEEQMQALFEAKLASTKNREYFLGLLYEDLKKL